MHNQYDAWAEIFSPIKRLFYASAVNNKSVQWEQRETETPGEGRIYHKKQLDVNATGDSALAKRLSGFTLTRLPLCGLQIGPGSMCSHPAHSWDPNTAASQAFQPKQPGVRSESRNVPAAACSYQSMFYFCVEKEKEILSGTTSKRTTSFLGDMKGNLGRPQFSMRSVSKAFQEECETFGRVG